MEANTGLTIDPAGSQGKCYSDPQVPSKLGGFNKGPSPLPSSLMLRDVKATFGSWSWKGPCITDKNLELGEFSGSSGEKGHGKVQRRGDPRKKTESGVLQCQGWGRWVPGRHGKPGTNTQIEDVCTSVI